MMPTYDYECDSCGHKLEVFHGMNDQPIIECPECGSMSLTKLIGPGAAAIVKGTSTPCRGEPRKPKLGSKLGEGENKTETPWWRSDKTGKVRKDILKNPEKYVKTGEVE